MSDAVPETHLTAEDRTKTVRLLNESQAAFLNGVDGLDDAQWSYKPSHDRWSIGEIAEHLVLSENVLFDTVERALTHGVNLESASTTVGKVEFLERVLVNRTGKARAPDIIQPRARMDQSEAVTRYKTSRARTLAFAERRDLPLKAVTRDHPFPFFGTLNGYQWLLYIPLHSLRHNQQIDEVKALDGFPTTS